MCRPMTNHSTNSTPASAHCSVASFHRSRSPGWHVAARAAGGDDETADLGVPRVDAHVDDSEDGVGVDGAGDHEDAEAATFGVEQDGDGVVAERSGE